jgi:dolichyl-diphosphooligosaccharide--protein glycosyltransferase
MYKLIYYRFGEMKSRRDEDMGFDTVRGSVIGNKNYKLTHFEEAFSSYRWLVRIYKVLPLPSRDPAVEPRFTKPSTKKSIISLPKTNRPTF